MRLQMEIDHGEEEEEEVLVCYYYICLISQTYRLSLLCSTYFQDPNVKIEGGVGWGGVEGAEILCSRSYQLYLYTHTLYPPEWMERQRKRKERDEQTGRVSPIGSSEAPAIGGIGICNR